MNDSRFAIKHSGNAPRLAYCCMEPPEQERHWPRTVAKSLSCLLPCKLLVVEGEISSCYVGAQEEVLRTTFEEARKFVRKHGEMPGRAMIFLDTSRSASESTDEYWVVAQLLTLMDGVQGSDARIIVEKAATCPAKIDDALRRPGRFETEIATGRENVILALVVG